MTTNKILPPDQQFIAYYDKLRDELNKAYTYYEISKTLREMMVTRRAEFSEALTFFSLTLYATLFSAVMSISRFIDSRRDSLHLHEFFKFVKNNLDLFSARAYEERLLKRGMDSEECGHWLSLHTDVTAEMVEQDKAKIASLPCRNLRAWRNKKLAHIDRSAAIKSADIMEEYPVTIQEIDTIILTLHEILDRYRVAYDGVSWLLGLPSVKPQIKYVMDAISYYRQSKRGEIKKSHRCNRRGDLFVSKLVMGLDLNQQSGRSLSPLLFGCGRTCNFPRGTGRR